MVWASGKEACLDAWMPPRGCVSDMSHWEDVLRQTKDWLERLYLLAGLGMPWCPPGRAEGCASTLTIIMIIGKQGRLIHIAHQQLGDSKGLTKNIKALKQNLPWKKIKLKQSRSFYSVKSVNQM